MDLYIKTQRWRYHRGNREMKKRILDEFCETYGYHRKAAARLLRQLPISDHELPQINCCYRMKTGGGMR
ncbi:TPA: hypothetical protein NGG79_001200 [Legionella pneumophila]|uniref:hypothetical protein n=1 Tax=Legionella pneumophila TaxID=446 RepID=UPI001A2185C5|nr:hypothetical protein [Legionella pneumophila]HAT1858428.1 hypothetical protein [Legionella pneumophila]HAT1871405.1 hypothetical protein [Legionella pneumophila]HBA1594158.1 hypothetical protein [Legionella pneumophila]HCD9273551.1 hypothetical protein [Legionella pneumophila]